MNTKHATSPRAIPRVVALLSILISSASAQTAPEKPKSNEPIAEEEVLQLSVFEVRATAEDGYATTSGVTVSRVATPVTEVPVSVITINEKLIQDTMAITAADTLDLVSGVQASAGGSSGNQESNEYSIRGYSTANAQRDGVSDALFTANGGFDYSFVERIEIAKGPNGIIYGNHSPGGVVNIISKRPLTKARTKISMTAGSFGTLRGEVDTSGFFDKNRRFGYRVAAAAMDTDGAVDFPGDPKKGFRGINPSLIYRSKNDWQVWAWSTFVESSSNRAQYMTRAFASVTPPSSTAPAAVPSGTTLIDRNLLDQGGGNSLITNNWEVNTDSYEIGASKSIEIGKIHLDARILGRYRDQFSDASRVRGIGTETLLGEQGVVLGTDSRRVGIDSVTNGKLTGIYRNTLGYDYRPSTNKQYDYNVDLNFTFDLGPTSHRLLLRGGLTSGDSDSTSITYQIASNTAAGRTALQSLGYEIVNNSARIWLYPLDKAVRGITGQQVVDKATSVTASSTSVSEVDAHSFGVMDRISLLDKRLFFVVGTNYTDNKQVTVATVSNVNVTRQEQRDKTWTPGYSGLFKAYRGDLGEAVVFANFNRTYTPVFTLDRRLPTLGQRLPNRSAENEEYGLKFLMFKERIVATVSHFNSEETNALVSLVDVDGSITGIINGTYSAPIGVRTAKGWDFDLNLRPFRGADLVVAYSKLDTRLQDGTIPPGVADTTLSLLGRYEFGKGKLKGLSAMWIYKRWGESSMNANTPLWTLPPGDQHSAVLTYARKNWRLSLKVDNIFDQESIRPSQFYTAIALINERSYRLGLGYSF